MNRAVRNKNAYIEEPYWQSTIRELRYKLIPRPISNSLIQDIYCLYVVLVAQFIFSSHILPSTVAVNLVTPWVIAYAARSPFAKSAIIASLAALSIEFHTSAPNFLYLTGYWSIISMLALVKEAFSWQHVEPWVFATTIAESFIVCYEQTIKMISEPDHYLQLEDLTTYILRIIIAGFLAQVIFIVYDDGRLGGET